MHGACFDFPLQKWFEFKVPKTTMASNIIREAIAEIEIQQSSNSKLIWLGKLPDSEIVEKSKKGSKWEVMSMSFQSAKGSFNVNVEPDKGKWLLSMLPKLNVTNPRQHTIQEVKSDYEKAGLEDFELFWDNKPISGLYKAGLLRV